MDNRLLSERDNRTKFVTPALRNAGREALLQICEEVSFKKHCIIARATLVSWGIGTLFLPGMEPVFRCAPARRADIVPQSVQTEDSQGNAQSHLEPALGRYCECM